MHVFLTHHHERYIFIAGQSVERVDYLPGESHLHYYAGPHELDTNRPMGYNHLAIILCGVEGMDAKC